MPSASLLRMAALSGGLLFSGCYCAVPASHRFDERRIAQSLIQPPAEYHRWWKKAEQCAGIEKPMKVRFYVIAKQSFRLDSASGLKFLGLYHADSNKITGKITERIYLAAPWMHTEWLVVHEMLHAVLQRDSSIAGHPLEFFAVRCRLMNFQHVGQLPTPPPLTAPLIPIADQRIPHLPEVP